MQVLGLTGGIASGKSTVSEHLRSLGANVIDADAVYHDLVAPVDGGPSPVTAQIAEAFEGVVREDGSLDRAELGPQVFGDPEALARLGAITHPAVAAEVGRRIGALAEAGVERVVYDVPLLYERGLEAGMHAVMVVWVPREIQRERLMARDGIDADTADKKLASQMPLDEKRARADHVIDNSGTREATRAQVEELWRKLT